MRCGAVLCWVQRSWEGCHGWGKTVDGRMQLAADKPKSRGISSAGGLLVNFNDVGRWRVGCLGQDLVAGEDGKVLVGEQENRLGRVWGRRSEKISVGGRRLRLGGRRESTAHTGPRGGLLKHGHPGHPRAGAQATRGKRIGRRGRPRRIVPPSTPARLLLGGEAPNTMPPALCCFLLGHGAQLDRPLGMPTRDWLPPKLHRAPDVDVVDLFSPCPSGAWRTLTTPPSGLDHLAAERRRREAGHDRRKEPTSSGPQGFLYVLVLTNARGALVTPFRLAPSGPCYLSPCPVCRLPAVNLGCILGPTQGTSWRLARRQRGKPRWAGAGRWALGAGQLIELFSPIHPGETFVPLTATLDAISGIPVCRYPFMFQAPMPSRYMYTVRPSGGCW